MVDIDTIRRYSNLLAEVFSLIALANKTEGLIFDVAWLQVSLCVSQVRAKIRLASDMSEFEPSVFRIRRSMVFLRHLDGFAGVTPPLLLNTVPYTAKRRALQSTCSWV